MEDTNKRQYLLLEIDISSTSSGYFAGDLPPYHFDSKQEMPVETHSISGGHSPFPMYS